MKAIRMDESGSVLIQSDSLFFWVDVYEDHGELQADWNQYIFHTQCPCDTEKKAFQDDTDNFSEATSIAIEYYERAIK